jgi:hypothetical protein
VTSPPRRLLCPVPGTFLPKIALILGGQQGSVHRRRMALAACFRDEGGGVTFRGKGRWDRLAIFRAYAKVLEPDDPAARLYEAGVRTCSGPPGLVLADVLRRTGGVYETTTELSPQFHADLREVAELASDLELLAIADLIEVPVPVGHLRGLDPQTRRPIRTELRYEADEGVRVGGAREHRPVLATITPDGTGDAFPAPPTTTS